MVTRVPHTDHVRPMRHEHAYLATFEQQHALRFTTRRAPTHFDGVTITPRHFTLNLEDLRNKDILLIFQ